MRSLSFGYLCLVLSVAGSGRAAEPLLMRIENFTVQPSSQPLLAVQIKNISDQPFAGTITPQVPGSWQLARQARRLALAPGEQQRLTFSVERGVDAAPNAYRLAIAVRGPQTELLHRQVVHVASTPYFKPTIDGDPAEWKDAIPLEFSTGGRRTTISTYWNRRRFSLLVAVEEEQLVPRGVRSTWDAVQVAIAARDARTAVKPSAPADRFEFLLVADRVGQGRCFQLAEPGVPLAETQAPRTLDSLEYDAAEIVVRRADDVTYYECSLPFGPMRRAIRPSEGRTYRFSILVHDPDGTGLRDLGQAVGLWEIQRNALAWSRWSGAQWGKTVPLDSKIEWGFCSSRY